jgi:16S rRNA (cytosine967-C5)-methyltransferase
MPFGYWLKKYFAHNKKHGSKDRKHIAHLCYCYFRLGHAFKSISVAERLTTALFLCNAEAGEWKILFEEKWLQQWGFSLPERIDFVKTIYKEFDIDNIFPLENELSEEIDLSLFAQSYLIQPDLFLRIRPHKEKQVINKLKAGKIEFNEISNTCLSLRTAAKIENELEENKEVVVQDYSSQRVTEFLVMIKSVIQNRNTGLKIWDCCAGSGGKSILAFDVLQDVHLTVSDVRPSILSNLKRRFRKAGINHYHTMTVDLTKPQSKAMFSVSGIGFDLIICDAPCTGSGTWSRTPEQLFFFESGKINHYTSLQKKIIDNTIPHVNKNGYFLYITCSIFKKENEEIIEYILQQSNLRLIKKELLIGYDKKADTMFAALFCAVS